MAVFHIYNRASKDAPITVESPNGGLEGDCCVWFMQSDCPDSGSILHVNPAAVPVFVDALLRCAGFADVADNEGRLKAFSENTKRNALCEAQLAAADFEYENYYFADGPMEIESSGWEYIVGSGVYERKVYLSRSPKTDSVVADFVVRFQPGCPTPYEVSLMCGGALLGRRYSGAERPRSVVLEDGETKVPAADVTGEAEVAEPQAATISKNLISKLLRVIDDEIEQRKHSGNDEHYADLAQLSDEGHAVLRAAVSETPLSIDPAAPLLSEAALADFMMERIENGSLDLGDIPLRLARYGLMTPQAFSDEMRERMEERDDANGGEGEGDLEADDLVVF